MAQEIENCYLGQFVPVHYHHNMLMDSHRMKNFKRAIAEAVFPGARVLELGCGTGAFSFFAAASASQVWSVEWNPDMVEEARRLLALNPHRERITVIQADAFDYLPPEPVDVVICDMLFAGLLREQQVAVLESFKRRYIARFGRPLPRFLPEAVVLAVQPLYVDYAFDGYHAPIVQFQDLAVAARGSIELAAPRVYHFVDFAAEQNAEIAWSGRMAMAQGGTINALRFITKNILALHDHHSAPVEWNNQHMALPLAAPLTVAPGDVLEISFRYRAGGSIAALQQAIEVRLHPAHATSAAVPAMVPLSLAMLV